MELISTRGGARRVPFLAAVATNVPGDGGLYVPADLAPFADAADLLDLDWRARAAEILARLLAPELDRAEVAALAAGAFDFPVPLVGVRDGLWALELFHGPSLSFKDFGVRFLARVLALAAERSGERRERLVLTATSGDTGAAVAAAFHGLAGFRVAVLYPAGRISERQERQIATLGGNVRAFAVDGDFDACQRLVKRCFADAALAAELGLISANSINVARLTAQILYYFEAAAALRRALPGAPPPLVAVPSGNFGNLCAGLLACRLGLPLRGLVLATNANRTVPDYLDSGSWVPGATVATLSNAMDVSAPNNWERVEWLFGADLAALRAGLRWGSLDDAGTLAEIARLDRLGYRADPHGAVAAAVLERALAPGEAGVFLATAHPAKFEATAAGLPLPEPLARALARPLAAESLPADPARLAAALRSGR